MKNSKLFFLTKIKDRFPVPDFFVLKEDLKNIFASKDEKSSHRFLKILKASAPANFFKTGETFIVRSLHPYEGNVGKSFSGIFLSKTFTFPRDAFLASKEVFESYFSKIASDYSQRNRPVEQQALMFQKYISGINGVAIFFGEKGDFFLKLI